MVENDYVVGFASIGAVGRVAADDDGFAALEPFMKQVERCVVGYDLPPGFVEALKPLWLDCIPDAFVVGDVNIDKAKRREPGQALTPRAGIVVAGHQIN